MPRSRISQCCFIAMALVFSPQALPQAPVLPPAATPGGALPKLDQRTPEPFVYPETVLPSEQPAVPAAPTETDAPRMLVRGFRVQGVIEHEELGITQQAVEQLVVAEARKLIAAETEQGFTLVMFESLTRAISGFYRGRGFFLARAYVPEQKVNDGIVSINIVEGFLDQVVFRNNDLYSDEQLDDLFDDLIGEAVFLDDIERVIFIANDLPGLGASALFGPGLKPGSAAIQVTTSEDPSSGFVSWDNYGSFYTGEQRLRLNYVRHNLLGNADRIDMNAMYNLDPQNGTYFDINYGQPVLNYDFNAGGGFIWNSFDVGGELEDLKINGETTIVNGHLTYFYKRKRNARMSATVDLALKESESLVINTTDSRDKLTVLSLQGLYQGTSWSGSGAYQQLAATLSLGLDEFLGSMDSDGDGMSGRTGGSGDFAGGDFTKLNIDYLHVKQLANLQSLTFKFSAQITSDLLTSLEQFALGGPDTVRAYPVGEALVDEVVLMNLEWRARASRHTPLNFLNGLQYLAFFDYADGSLNDPLNNEVDEVKFYDFGFGLEIEPYRKYRASITYAFDLGDEPSDNQSLPFYFNLQYDFQ